MQIHLDLLINQALEELKRLGLHQSTIKTYRYSAYSPIRNYCARHGITYYEPAILDEFLSSQKKRIGDSEISKGYYRSLYRAVQVLKNVFHHGALQWDHCSKGSAYKLATLPECLYGAFRIFQYRLLHSFASGKTGESINH